MLPGFGLFSYPPGGFSLSTLLNPIHEIFSHVFLLHEFLRHPSIIRRKIPVKIIALHNTRWHSITSDSQGCPNILFCLADSVSSMLHLSAPLPAFCPLLKYSPLHGLMQAHRTRHKPTNRNEVHCLNNTIHYPNMGTVKKAAEIYGLSPHYIRRLCRTGKIRYVNAGHKWLINLDSLAKYFEQGDPSPADQSQTAHGIRQIG